jgi:ATP-binding protein involved in chromosome partitioning
MEQHTTSETTDSRENFKEENLKRIKHTIVILSNKGGVGKSTVSTNISSGLAMNGLRTGILDADIHGPSINKMLGIEGKKITYNELGHPGPIRINDKLVALSTSAFLEDESQPLIWRGPLKIKLLSQFIEDFYWPELDYLVIDCPPGTGDEPLSVINLYNKIDYAVVVTTPQDVALLDVKKAINFLKQLEIKNIGIIENMSGLICPHCNNEIKLFNKNSVEKVAREFDIEMLGNIPLEMKISEMCDRGEPYISTCKGEKTQQIFTDIIEKITKRIREQN